MALRPASLIALLPLLLTACAAQVTHPTKSVAEQRADIDFCTREANHKYWMDPIAALLHAYDCLEAKGYQKVRTRMAAQVQETVGPNAPRPPRPASVSTPSSPSPAPKPGAVEPCRVPCAAPKG